MSFGVALSGVLLTFRSAGMLEGFRFAMMCGAAVAASGIVLAMLQRLRLQRVQCRRKERIDHLTMMDS